MSSSIADDVVTTVLETIEDRGYDDEKHKSSLIKDEANQFFKDQAYDVSIKLYTEALQYHETAILYSNRSMAYMKTELYGSALDDASKAIELDPSYVKGFYRRASANMALGRFKKALTDYQTVVKVRPNDTDAKKKCEECQKIVRRVAFEKAISTDHDKKEIAETIDINTMIVDDSYDGPHLEGSVTESFMVDLINHQKEQKRLHKKYAFKMLLDFYDYLKSQPTLVEITVPDSQKFTICGDVHGQFYDLCNIFDINGMPSETNPYLFNGDFVDRGSFSVETIFTMIGFKLLYPNHFFMSRGNHESDVMNKMYGFEGEVRNKYNSKMSEFFTEIFCHLPLFILFSVCHGGLFKEDGVTLDDIRQTRRVRQPPDEGIMCDLLWSDPQPLNGRSPSKRGVGCQFGPDVTEAWCSKNGIEYVVRSHEVKPEGYEEHHDGKCYTVFSAPNYCDQMGNKGAFITIRGNNLKPNFTTFEAAPHPKLAPMAYASSLFGFN